MKKLAVLLIMLILVSGLALADNTTINQTNSTDNTTINYNLTSDDSTENNTVVDNQENEINNPEDNEVNDGGANVEIEGEDIKINERELKAFYGNGAEVRTLQLIRHTTRNVLIGTETIMYLDSDETKETAQAILSELSSIISELEKYNYEDKTQEELVEDFLTYKTNAADLSKEFKELVTPEIDDDERQQLSKTIKGIMQTDIKPLDDEIRALINSYNAEVFKKRFENMDVDEEAAIEKIRNGEMTVTQAKERILERFNSLSDDNKAKFSDEMREAIKEKNEFKKQTEESIVDQAQIRVRETRIEQYNQIEKLRSRIQNGELTNADIASTTRANSDKYKLIAQQRAILNSSTLSLDERAEIRSTIDHRLGVQEQQAIKEMIQDGNLDRDEAQRIQSYKYKGR